MCGDVGSPCRGRPPDVPKIPMPARLVKTEGVGFPFLRPLARAAARAKRSLFRGRRCAGTHGTRERPFLSYTGRGAFFLFGASKRKNGGRIAHRSSCKREKSNAPPPHGIRRLLPGRQAADDRWPPLGRIHPILKKSKRGLTKQVERVRLILVERVRPIF